MSAMGTLRAAAFAAATLAAGAAMAVQPDEVLQDPKLETRARALSSELRCLVCQNQSIDDSDAPLARDLRVIVREKIQAGASDGEIRSYLVDRYGAFVLLRPPFAWNTLLLWSAPFLLLAGGAAVVWSNARRRREAGAPALSAQEKAALDKITGGG
jgi:cytochrome c-type biogenesis protein CcmH